MTFRLINIKVKEVSHCCIVKISNSKKKLSVSWCITDVKKQVKSKKTAILQAAATKFSDVSTLWNEMGVERLRFQRAIRSCWSRPSFALQSDESRCSRVARACTTVARERNKRTSTLPLSVWLRSLATPCSTLSFFLRFFYECNFGVWEKQFGWLNCWWLQNVAKWIVSFWCNSFAIRSTDKLLQ